MVNKFKTLLKKEKGFTLVELLAVIVILGIIVAIAIPAIGNIIDTAEEDATDAEDALIIDAARLFDTQIGVGEDNSVTVGELVTEGYLEPRESDNITKESTRIIYKSENTFTFTEPTTTG